MTRFLGRVLGAKLFRAGVVVVAACYIAIWVNDEKPSTRRELARILFDNAEPIAIASAAAVFLLEIPDRQKAEQYGAWQVINSAMGQTGSGGRIQALEDLNREGVDLTGVAVPEAELSGINLRFARLPGANFYKTKLHTADLTKASLMWANLGEAGLYQAKLMGANLTGINLCGANLMQSNLSESYLGGADLREACLYKAKLIRANFNGANLRESTLAGADLKEADLSRANLSGARLTSTNLSGANLSKANLSNIIWDDTTQWPASAEVAQARNIPDALKKALDIKDSTQD